MKRTAVLNDVAVAGILHGISFTWRQGESLALMGANGSGKSTLAKALAGQIPAARGSIQVYDEVCDGSSSLPLWQQVAYIGQHPQRQVIGATVGEELAFALLNRGYPARVVEKKVTAALAELGLIDKEKQSPHTLSGGERQRLVIAAVLLAGYPFIILDEALAMLDWHARRLVCDYVAQHARNAGLLWITHDPELAAKQDRLLLLKDGRLKEVNVPAAALTDPELCHEYGIRPLGLPQTYTFSSPSKKLNSARYFETIKDFETIIDFKTKNDFTAVNDFAPAKNLKIAKDCETAKDLETEKNFETTKGFKPGKNYEIAQNFGTGKLVATWENAEFAPPHVHLNAVAREGEFIAVVGASGSGKSTLLESLIGVRRPLNGKVEVSPEARIGFMLQEAGEYLLGRTAYQEIFGKHPPNHSHHRKGQEKEQQKGQQKEQQKKQQKEQKKQRKFSRLWANRLSQAGTEHEDWECRCRAYLRKFGMESCAHQPLDSLSGGQRQIVALAAVLENNPTLLLLDEPLLGLDNERRQLVLKKLQQLKAEARVTVLYATHDLEEVLSLADRLWLVANGRIVLDCPASLWENYKQELARAWVKIPGQRLILPKDHINQDFFTRENLNRENTDRKYLDRENSDQDKLDQDDFDQGNLDQNYPNQNNPNDQVISHSAQYNGKPGNSAQIASKPDTPTDTRKSKNATRQAILAALDPRLKLVALMLLSLLLTFVPAPGLAVATLFVVYLIAMAPQTVVSWKSVLLGAGILGLFYAILLGWEGYSGLKIWQGHWNVDGLAQAAVLTWKIALIFSLTLIFISVTAFGEQGQAITWLLSPFSKVKGRGDLALLIMLTLRFIPLFKTELWHLRKARLAKGPLLPGLRGKVRDTVQLVFPLLRLSLRRAEEMSAAILGRGYDPAHYRGYQRWDWGAHDRRALVFTGIWLLLIALVSGLSGYVVD